LLRRGAHAIGDAELVAIVLGTGVRARPALEVAADLVREVGGVAAMSRASPRELAQVTGVGAARSAQLAAAFELGRRAMESELWRDPLGSAEDVYRCIAPRLVGLQQELFFAIGLDIRNGVLDVVEVGRGSVHGVEVHPREVFRPLVRMAAAGGVLVHNHPSGDATPSPEDISLTRRLQAVGELLGIPVVDHVVVAPRAFRSIREYMGGDTMPA
jgi:DNA repair protein RadC